MSAPMTPEQRKAIAAQIGEAQAATNGLVGSLAESVANVRNHEHPSWEDLYCLNLTSYMGERMAPVLKRLLDAESELAGKDTQPGESTPTLSARGARTAVLIALARGLREQPTGARLLDGLDELGEAAVCEDATAMTEWADALAALVGIDEALGAAAAAPLTVYRAEHETIRVGHYTTEAAARRHCEALISDEHPADRTLSFDWIGDEDDPEEPRELVVQVDGGDEELTGYVVVPLAVAVAYDPDAE